MEHQLVYRNPNSQYHADFPGVTVAEDDSVVVVLRHCGPWAWDATFKYGRILTFFEAEADIIVLRSTDDGRSFTPVGRQPLHQGLAYDPLVYRLMSGRLVAGCVVGGAASRPQRHQLEGVLHRHLPQLNTIITVQGYGLWFSDDSGETWTEQPCLVTVPGYENMYNLRPPVQLADGTILLPVAIGYPWRARFVGLIRSWDEGRTWGDPCFVAEDPAARFHFDTGAGYWQPALAVNALGELLCITVEEQKVMGKAPGQQARDAGFGGKSRLFRSHSYDSGFTWSAPTPTGLTGDFPDLITLRDGRYLLVFTRRDEGSRLEAAMSSDGGATWEESVVLRSESDHEFYYPHSVQMPDGSILTVYMTAQPDKVRIVEAVRWEVP